MNELHLVTMTRGGSLPGFRFVAAGGFDRASYLAGVALDAWADATGATDLDYSITAVPYVGATADAGQLLRAVRDLA